MCREQSFADRELLQQFQAVEQLGEDDKHVVKRLLAGSRVCWFGRCLGWSRCGLRPKRCARSWFARLWGLLMR
jgi:hypothetical protein